MDEYYENENYATIGHAPAQPWEILPIWLYLVSLTTLSPKVNPNPPQKLKTPQTALTSAYDALQSFIPSLSKRTLLTRYPSSPWQECSSLAARQFGVVNVLLTVVRVHTGLSIHSYGAYNTGILFAAIMLLHYVSERMAGSIRGSALSGAEVVVFVTFVWMMVQRGEYVGELISSFSLAYLGLVWGGLLTICSAERSSSWDGGTCFASSHARRAGLPRSTSWGCHLNRGHVLKSCFARKWKHATIGICSHCGVVQIQGAETPAYSYTVSTSNTQMYKVR